MAALLVAGSAAAAPLTLDEAVRRARATHPSVAAASAAARAAAARVTVAEAGRLPSADVTESWQRGNQPVYAFGSLLSQRRFLAENFALDYLNHPPATNNLRLGVTVEQPLFNRATEAAVRSARLAGEMADTARTAVQVDLRLAVTEAYAGLLASTALHRAARQALDAAAADRERAGHRRDAGRATDADVLQFDVLVARARARAARAAADETVARARLNALVGEPVDAPTDVAAPDGAPVPDAAGDVTTRPDVRLARAREALAAADVDRARAAFLPQVAAQAGWEANGGSWATRSPSWAVGVMGRVNVFRGGADRAQLAAAKADAEARAAERQQAERVARVEVVAARARLDAALAAEAAGRSAVAQAVESRRIVRDRYEQGLADSVALLNAAELVADAEAADAAAAADVMVARAALDRAMGRE
ncbi:MAG: TolC family protein [Vicinamibacterales bacterium]